jgi:hypothetical protein
VLRSLTSRVARLLGRRGRLRPDYFGLDVAALAETLRAGHLGVYSDQYIEAQASLTAGRRTLAVKQIVDVSGCTVEDADLAVELLHAYPPT